MVRFEKNQNVPNSSTKCDFFFPKGIAGKFNMSVLFVVFSLLVSEG